MAENEFNYEEVKPKPPYEEIGLENVELPRERLYKTESPGIDTLQIRELPNFLRLRLEASLNEGRFLKSFSHYIGALRGLRLTDDSSIQHLRELRGKINGSYQHDKEVLQEVVSFLDSWRPHKK